MPVVGRSSASGEQLGDTAVATAERRVRAEGAVLISKLLGRRATKSTQARLVEALERCGLERGVRHVRIPLADQLSLLLEAEGELPLKGLKRRIAGATSEAEVRKEAFGLVTSRKALLTCRGGVDILFSDGAPILTPEELEQFRRALERARKTLSALKGRKGQPRRVLSRHDAETLVKDLLPASAGEIPSFAELLAAIQALETPSERSVFLPDLVRSMGGRIKVQEAHRLLGELQAEQDG